MTIRWTPDTCFCLVDIDVNYNLENIIERCEKHKNTPEQNFMLIVGNHCRNFQLPANPTAQQAIQNGLDKRAEKESTRRN